MRPPVWVTGVGVISAAGNGREALAEVLRTDRSVVAPIAQLAGYTAGRAAIDEFDRSLRRLDRSAAFFAASAAEAWRDAGFDDVAQTPERFAIVEGSSLGPLAATLESHAERLAAPVPPTPRPSALLKYMSGTGGAAAAKAFGVKGPVLHISAWSVSGACAIGEAYEMILSGRVDVAIAGGTECPLHPEIFAHLAAAGLLAEREGEGAGCLPFDRRRSGTILGEGAGVLILESAEHARRRRVLPRALLHGFGLSCEAHSATSPEPEGHGVAASIRGAMRGIPLARLRWVKTHGTGTRLNDAAECRGIATALGGLMQVTPLTSLKPTLGHALGASGATEAVAAVLALREGFIPATLGTQEVDPELPPCHLVTSREKVAPGIALVLAEGFGGRCAALALEAA